MIRKTGDLYSYDVEQCLSRLKTSDRSRFYCEKSSVSLHSISPAGYVDRQYCVQNAILKYQKMKETKLVYECSVPYLI